MPNECCKKNEKTELHPERHKPKQGPSFGPGRECIGFRGHVSNLTPYCKLLTCDSLLLLPIRQDADMAMKLLLRPVPLRELPLLLYLQNLDRLTTRGVQYILIARTTNKTQLNARAKDRVVV